MGGLPASFWGDLRVVGRYSVFGSARGIRRLMFQCDEESGLPFRSTPYTANPGLQLSAHSLSFSSAGMVVRSEFDPCLADVEVNGCVYVA